MPSSLSGCDRRGRSSLAQRLSLWLEVGSRTTGANHGSALLHRHSRCKVDGRVRHQSPSKTGSAMNAESARSVQDVIQDLMQEHWVSDLFRELSERQAASARFT